jgi:hypothetical protein
MVRSTAGKALWSEGAVSPISAGELTSLFLSLCGYDHLFSSLPPSSLGRYMHKLLEEE